MFHTTRLKLLSGLLITSSECTERHGKEKVFTREQILIAAGGLDANLSLMAVIFVDGTNKKYCNFCVLSHLLKIYSLDRVLLLVRTLTIFTL